MVEDFQTHKHTCEKKNKRVSIRSREGHGKLEGNKISQVVQFRFNFPQFPLHKTSFILSMLSDEQKANRKKDLKKIKQFLIKINHPDEEMNNTNRKNFKDWTFVEFLFEVGMFEKTKEHVEDYSNEEKNKALCRYINALSASVRGSGSVFMQRGTRDVFTNNFNRRLLNGHKANHDL